MAAEVLFRWNNTTVNLKMARSVVRFLAEHHGRLTEVGPTQCLRDILDWFKNCDPDTDESFRALEEKHGHSEDFDSVCSFLKAYDYDGLRRSYPKQCGSLWMAVRGVCRRINQKQEPESSTLSSKSSKSSESSRGTTHMSPETYVQSIREGSDEIAFELLMLLSNPDTNRLGRSWTEQLEHTERTLMNALVDLRLILRNLHEAHGDDDVAMKDEPPYDDEDGDGRGNRTDRGAPGSPDSGYPTSPGGSSTSGDSGFGGGNGGGGPGYTWYSTLPEELQKVTLTGESKASETPVLKASSSATEEEKRISMKRSSKRFSFASAAKAVSSETLKRLSVRKSKTPCQQSAFEGIEAVTASGAE